MNHIRRVAKTTGGRIVVVFLAGLIAGAVYWSLHVSSPAPPPASLVGLLGILIGEAVASRIILRLGR